MLGMHKLKGGSKVHWPAEVAGWVGAISVLLAYMLAVYGVIDANGFWYAFFELGGCGGYSNHRRR